MHHPAAALRLKIGVGLLQKDEQFLRHGANVLRVDERKRQLHRSAPDRHVRIFETLQDGAAVPLDGGNVRVDRPQQGVERHVADVFVAVEQKPAEDVDGQHPETTLGP